MLFIALLTLLSPLALALVKEDAVLWVYVFGVAQIVFISAALNEPALVRVRNAISVYALCLAAISIVSYSSSRSEHRMSPISQRAMAKATSRRQCCSGKEISLIS
jgi:hypothetical protein